MSFTPTAVSRRCATCGKLYPDGVKHSCEDQTPLPSVDAADILRGQDDLVGTVIGERFDVLERLTSGGMGVVYRAKHILLNSEVAIKVLLKPQDMDAQYRFLQEAQLACKVKHANTVFISDFGILADGRSYIAMEFLHGPTLGRAISEGPIAPLRACRITMQIARGLQAVHDKGIVHRDLKPENIFLVDQDGQKDFVKIVDFGIATDRVDTEEVRANLAKLKAEAETRDSMRSLKERHTLPGMVLGTPQYMSPEQAQGFDLDARADQYALGCIFYEMLCGSVPFDDGNAMAVMYKHALAPVPTLRERNAAVSVPDSVERIVKRMLAKDPASRFPSMREVEQALIEEIDGLLATASPEEQRAATGMLQRARVSQAALRGLNKARRWPLWMKLAAAWGGVLFIAASALIVYVVQKRRQAAEVEQAAQETQQLLAAREQALGLLKTDLTGASTELRLGAVAALGDTRDAALAPAILPLLDDKEPRVQIKAAEVLGQLGRRDVTSNLAPLTDEAAGRSPILQVASAEALDLLGDARGRKVLGKAMNWKHDGARLRAAVYLTGSGDREAQRLLSQVVQKGLVAEAAQLEILPKLAQAGDADAREALLTRLSGSPSRDTQIAVAGALLKLGEPRGREYLGDLIKKPGPEQLKAAVVMATQEEPVDPALFRGVLDSPQAHPAARKVALLGLGYTGRREDLRRLLPLLERADDPVLRQGAAAAVVRLAATDPAVVALQDLSWAQGALAGDSALLREQAVAVLGDVGTAAAARALGRTLRSGADANLRIKAARALAQVRDREALVALKEGLGDRDAGVRQEVIKALGEAGRRLLARGQKSVMGEISGWLSATIKPADPAAPANSTEQALARAALLRMGDDTQRAQVAAALKSSDVETRRQLVDQVDRDAGLLGEALTDSDTNVRRLAARRLAALGDKRAAPVLREIVQSTPESPEGLSAYALLRKLDQKVEAPAAPQQLLESQDPVARAAALEAVVAQGQPAATMAALQKAARDPERSVRIAAAELAAKQPNGTAVLRTLMRDPDPGVRARAAALLAQKDQPEEAPAPKPPEADKGDKGATKPATPEGDPQAAGEPEGDKKGTGSKPETDPADSREAIEKLVRAGRDALKDGQAGKAQRQLERAVSQCSHAPQKTCAPFAYELSYSLGRSLQAQNRYADAMTEYEKLRKVKGGTAAQKREVAGAVKELSPRLGKVTVLEKKKGKCQATAVFWLTPGQQTVRYGQSSFQVKLRAQESQSVSTDPSCDEEK